MLTKTKAAVVAAILLGSISGAVADTQFDVNIYHPNPYQDALGAYAQQPRTTTPRAVKPLNIDEQLWFDRASQRS